ncbi:hypothetical protein BDR06DRAFT_946942 [Suillus hirtellus]|nr:hypothetical protein BDR06DRAFT_946942 [Suillus hirtellus]
MSDANLAVTYSLIYAFLKQQSQTKAADAVKKAARNIIVLKDDLKLEGSSLDEIVKQWKESHADDSSSDSDSSDDSSDDSSTSSSSDSSSSSSDSTSGDDSDSSSSESESDSKKGTQVCKKVPESLSCGDRETSATLSSDAKVPEVKSKVTKKKPSVKGSSSSGSDSDSDDSTTDSASDKKLARKGTQKKDVNSSDPSSSSDSSSSSSDSSSSDSESTSSDSESTTSSSESESEAEITPISGKIPVGRGVASSKSRANTGVTSTPKEEMQVTKKRKTSESGAAVVTAVVSTHPTDDVQVSAKVKNIQKNGNGKLPRNANERFSRIKPQNIPAEQLLDNGYEAKGGVTNDYGNRAHQDLIVTRGAGFRKEKNKKKRGSYRGGEITLQSHSIKFTD